MKRTGTPAISVRQIEIIRLLWSGLSDKQVADAMAMTVPQVENSLRPIYHVHKLHNRADLFRHAGEAGIIGLTRASDRELCVIREVGKLLAGAMRAIETAYPPSTATVGKLPEGDTETGT